MRIFISPLTILLVIIFQSCTVHSGQVISLDYGQLISTDDVAIGIVQTTTIFGIGGNLHNTLLKEAKNNLIANRPLRKGEKYVNINLDIKTTVFLVGYVKTYTLSADVVTTEDGEIVYHDSVEELDNGALIKKRTRSLNELFIVTDTVLFAKTGLGYPKTVGKIISKSKSKCVVHYISDHKAKQRTLNISEIYRITGNHKGYTIGQHVEKNGAKGNIIAFGDFNILIIKDNGQKAFVKY